MPIIYNIYSYDIKFKHCKIIDQNFYKMEEIFLKKKKISKYLLINIQFFFYFGFLIKFKINRVHKASLVILN